MIKKKKYCYDIFHVATVTLAKHQPSHLLDEEVSSFQMLCCKVHERKLNGVSHSSINCFFFKLFVFKKLFPSNLALTRGQRKAKKTVFSWLMKYLPLMV